MGQGLEPLTADLCLSSRSQPPQLPSRADFFEQSKKRNVSGASTVTTTSEAAAQLQPLLLVRARKPLPAGQQQRQRSTRWHQPATLTASGRRIGTRVTVSTRPTGTTTTTCQRRWWWPQQGQQGDTRSTLSSMLPDFPSNANTMEFG